MGNKVTEHVATELAQKLIIDVANSVREQTLAEIYADPNNTKPAYMVVADLCDKVYDKSGAMLGRVRELARQLREKRT